VWTLLAHKHFATGLNMSLAMIMRGGFAGLSKNPPCLQAYFHAFNIYCYITFDHNLKLSCIPCTFLVTIGLLLKRFRVCFGLLCSRFLSSAPTCVAKHLQLLKLFQEKDRVLGQLHNFPGAPHRYSTNPWVPSRICVNITHNTTRYARK
jgi:hypothetical protein